MSEITAQISEDIAQRAHAAVCVGGRHGDLSEICSRQFDIALQLGQNGTQCCTCLRGFDACIRHQADCFRRILRAVAQRTGNRSTVFEGLAHHADIGVRIG